MAFGFTPPRNSLAASLEEVAWANTALTLAAEWALDCDGNWIKRSDYGKQTAHGWDVDHVIPKAIGGGDERRNLRARHWRSNRYAGSLLADALRR